MGAFARLVRRRLRVYFRAHAVIERRDIRALLTRAVLDVFGERPTFGAADIELLADEAITIALSRGGHYA